jgi:neopullulanase
MKRIKRSWCQLLCLVALPVGLVGQDAPGTPEEELRFPPGIVRPVYQLRSAMGDTKVDFRIDPPHWWVGMKNPEVQLMIHDRKVGNAVPSIAQEGVRIVDYTRLANDNYLFITLEIEPHCPEGEFWISLKSSEYEKTFPYTLKARMPYESHITPVDKSDRVYLIMPDRFANGDPNNDALEGMQQRGIDRGKMYFRHGGDLQGILNHLDYIEELGFTTLWLNPVQTNDQPYESYHGYAITDHYQIDPRLGDLTLYKTLSKALHERKMKLVMDIIHNHVGDQHYFIRDLPSEDWIHQLDTFTRSNYKSESLFDPYAVEEDKKILLEGWFDHHMPDLNQTHPFLANYLTQNTIWWVEEAGIDGFRIDTYYYPDLNFMVEWTQRVKREYPDLYLVGEAWIQSMPILSQFVEGNPTDLRREVGLLDAVTDFPLYYALCEALTTEQSWSGGVSALHKTLAHDFLFKDPQRNLTFLDNHDLSRFLSTVDGDVRKLKNALVFLFTTRGIPSLYYGTELLFQGYTNPDGKVRQDMPGGWSEDVRSVFLKDQRTQEEQQMIEFIAKLNGLRGEYRALQDGSYRHLLPQQGVYQFLREWGEERLWVVVNFSAEDRVVSSSRAQALLGDVPSALERKDLLGEEAFSKEELLRLKPYEAKVFQILSK